MVVAWFAVGMRGVMSDEVVRPFDWVTHKTTDLCEIFEEKFVRKNGRPRKYETPEQMGEDIAAYFRWARENPLYEAKYVGKDADEVALPRPRPFTITGMHLHMGISYDCWLDYKRNREGFSSVMIAAENMCRTQKFDGAAAGFFNANIIARDLGLADRQEQSGPGGGPVQHEISSSDDAREAARKFAEERDGG